MNAPRLHGASAMIERAFRNALRKALSPLLSETTRGTRPDDRPPADGVNRYSLRDRFREAIATSGELHRRIQDAAADTARHPTDDQKHAGNYRKGRFWMWGLEVVIENPRGSVRSGGDASGRSWSVTMPAHYGYIRRTLSEADGDHVDCFIGPHPTSEAVFVVNQQTAGGRFDEHKCVLGCRSLEEARRLYLAAYSPDWKGLASIVPLTRPQFLNWLEHGDTSRAVKWSDSIERFARHKSATGQQEIEWDEAKHSRDSDGMFSSGHSGSAVHSTSQPASKPKVAANVKAGHVAMRQAKAGGEVSEVTGKRYIGGHWMPVHGLSVGQAKPAKPPITEGDAPQANPNATMKGPPTARVMSAQDVENDRVRKEEQNHWNTLRSGPLGRVKWLGERPNSKAMADGGTALTDWHEWAESAGPAAIQKLIATLEPIAHRRIDTAFAEHQARWASTSEANKQHFGRAPSDDDADWEKNQIKEFGQRDSQQGRNSKTHEKKVPGSHYARALVFHVLSDKDGSTDDPIQNMLSVNDAMKRASQTSEKYSKDAAGHEHKGKGAGGGQFTGSGGGGASREDSPSNLRDSAPSREASSAKMPHPQVHTSEFKAWFGDWEAAAHRKFLDGPAVVHLKGDEFTKTDQPLTERVAAWFQSEHNGKATHPELGDVVLNERGVKESLAHGLGRDKATAFAAVPGIISTGRIIDRQTDWKGRGYEGVTLAAPIRMGGRDFVAVALVHRDQGTNRFYLHEVGLREKLQAEAFKTGASADNSGEPSGASAGAIKSVLQKIYQVKPDSTSQVVDEHGQPLVVYHGTDQVFESFKAGQVPPLGGGDSQGFYMTSDPKYAGNYGGVLKPVYLSLRNPYYSPKESFEHTQIATARQAELESQGHDGVIFMGDDKGKYPNEYIAFHPSQIKSATGNRGTFDPSDDRIAYSRQGLVDRFARAFRAGLVERYAAKKASKGQGEFHWVTIGGSADGEKQHAGGTPVLLDAEGRIASHPTVPALHGKKIGEVGQKAKTAAEPVRRRETFASDLNKEKRRDKLKEVLADKRIEPSSKLLDEFADEEWVKVARGPANPPPRENGNDLHHSRDELTKLAPPPPLSASQGGSSAPSDQGQKPVASKPVRAPEGGAAGSTAAKVMSEAEYIGPRSGIDPALHGRARGPGGSRSAYKSQEKALKREAVKAEKVDESRDKLRSEYQEKVAAGEIRPPTRRERLEKIAGGHPDNPSVQAARRSLADMDSASVEPVNPQVATPSSTPATAANPPAAEVGSTPASSGPAGAAPFKPAGVAGSQMGLFGQTASGQKQLFNVAKPGGPAAKPAAAPKSELEKIADEQAAKAAENKPLPGQKDLLADVPAPSPPAAVPGSHASTAPAKAQAQRDDGSLPGMDAAKSDETPRQAADRQQKAIDAEYEFARESKIRNAGEDLKGSARHKRNAWRGLEAAEADGSAVEMVTRDNLLKAEPHNLMTAAEKNPLTALAMHYALRAFPVKPGHGKQSVTAKERRDFHEAYQLLKAKADDLAMTESDPRAAIERLRHTVSEHIKALRGRQAGDRYNQTANALVGTSDALTTFRLKKTGALSKLNEFSKQVSEKYGAGTDAGNIQKHAQDIIEGMSLPESFNKKGEGKTRVSEFNPADLYVKHATRQGGRDVSHLTSSPDKATENVLKTFGSRGVQWGNSVTDDEREHHATKLVEALADLADVTGLKPEDIGLGGRMGWAIGARGHGRASAHYEPATQVINLTRASGVGALAHEWGHAFDHAMKDFGISRDGADYASENISSERFDKDEKGNIKTYRDEHGRIRGKTIKLSDDPMWKGFDGVRKAWKDSGYQYRLKTALNRMVDNGQMSEKRAKEYWDSTREKFARTFERHVQHALRAENRDNTYLTGMGDVGEDSLWPTDAEAKQLAPAFDALLSAYRKKKYGDEAPQKYSRHELRGRLRAVISNPGSREVVRHAEHYELAPAKRPAVRQQVERYVKAWDESQVNRNERGEFTVSDGSEIQREKKGRTITVKRYALVGKPDVPVAHVSGPLPEDGEAFGMSQRGEWTNEDTGLNINFFSDGVKDSVSSRSCDWRAFKAVPKLIEHSVRFATEPYVGRKKGFTQTHFFYSPLHINGEPHIAKLTVHVGPGAKPHAEALRLYNLRTTKENRLVARAADEATEVASVSAADKPASMSIGRLASLVKQIQVEHVHPDQPEKYARNIFDRLRQALRREYVERYERAPEKRVTPARSDDAPKRTATKKPRQPGDGTPGWQRVGGAPVFVNGSGRITKGCPGLKGEHVSDLIDEPGHSRDRREARQAHAEARGQTGHDLKVADLKRFETRSAQQQHTAAKTAAKRAGVPTVEVLKAMPDEHARLAADHNSLEQARTRARQLTGLNSARQGFYENAYRDHSSVTGFDVAASDFASEHRHLGFDPDDSDNASRVWDFIREGARPAIRAWSSEVADSVAERLSSGLRRQFSAVAAVEEDWSPF